MHVKSLKGIKRHIVNVEEESPVGESVYGAYAVYGIPANKRGVNTSLADT